jgi:transcriptional regulator with XRE-family HTH domain
MIRSVPNNRKSLDVERNETVRAVVRRAVAEDYEGNGSAAAKDFGVSQATLSDFLAGHRGAGVALLYGVAKRTGISVDALLGLAPMPTDTMPNRTLVMRSPEFNEAHGDVQSAFISIDPGEDLSVVGWSLELARLIEWQRRGWPLEPLRVDASDSETPARRTKLALVTKPVDNAKDRDSGGGVTE